MFTVIMMTLLHVKEFVTKGGGGYKTGLTVVEQKKANSLPDWAEHKEH